MKMFKKIAAAFLTVAMAVTMFASAYSASAAGFASSMLTPNQRKIYNELVKKYVVEFNYGSTGSFALFFKDNFEFDETEATVETTDVFLAVSMFVADYAYALPWLDYEGKATEDYDLPFVGAAVPYTLGEIELNLIVAMFAVKAEYQGEVQDLFGNPNTIIIDPNPTVADTNNLAIGATVTVDSVAQDADGNPRGDLAAHLGNDGDYSTRWQAQTTASEATPCWFAVDLGEAKTFDRIRMYWETARADKDGFAIQYSDDGETWTDATIVSKQRTEVSKAGNNEHEDYVVLEPVTAQYVRVYVTKYEKLGNVSLFEFEVYNGEIIEPAPAVTGIEVTKAPDKTTYYAGTYPYVDLTGMELTLTYENNTTKVMTADELEAVRGYGSKDLFFACVDDYSSSISISYLGFEASTPITLSEEEPPVVAIEVVSEPTGEGLRGIVFNAYDIDGNATELTIAEDAEAIQSTDMMGISVESYVVEYLGEKYLAIGLSYEGGGMLGGILGGLGGGEEEPAPEEGGEAALEEVPEEAPDEGEGDTDLGAIIENGFSIITFMGCMASTLPIEIPTFTLTPESTYVKDDAYLVVSNIPEGTTVEEFKTNFVEDIQLTDIDSNVIADDAEVTDGMWIMVDVEGEYVDTWYTTVIGELTIPDEPTVTLTNESTYTLDGLYVFDVPAGTTIAEFKTNFVEFIEVTDDEGNILPDDALVGTGMWLLSSNDGEGYFETGYEVVVSGDTNGDGKINSTDFMQIRRNFLGLHEFDSLADLFAADTNGDDSVNSTDFMQVRRHFLGLYDLYA